jgi:Domain of unknown function (DUF4292)
LHKVKIILFSILLFTGCSVLKKGQGEVFKNTDMPSGKQILEKLQKRNLSNRNFYIQKAEVQIFGQGGVEKLLLSVKYRKPDKYLISVRSKTGIEAARLFISADTILLNDRINRRLYCSSPDYLKKKYGLTLSVIPVLIGDYIVNNESSFRAMECIENRIKINGTVDGLKINYLIDCTSGKSVLSILESSLSSERIEVKNSEFFELENNIIPGNIEINDYKRESIINIKIRKMTFLWEGNIEFIPGNKYEIIELL